MFRKVVLIAVGIIFVAAIAWLFIPITPKQPDTQTTGEGIHLERYGEGDRLLWRLDAASGRMSGESGWLEQVDMLFFRGDESRLLATADKLTFEEESVVLSGNVEIAGDSGQRMKTEQATWYQEPNNLVAGSFSLLASNWDLQGAQCEYDLSNETFCSRSGFEAQIRQPQWFDVSGDEICEQRGRITASGAVVLQGENSTYRCSQVDYDEDSERIELIGEVDGTFSGGRIRAEVVTLSDGDIDAQGEVELSVSGDFLTGNDDT